MTIWHRKNFEAFKKRISYFSSKIIDYLIYKIITLLLLTTFILLLINSLIGSPLTEVLKHDKLKWELYGFCFGFVGFIILYFLVKHNEKVRNWIDRNIFFNKLASGIEDYLLVGLFEKQIRSIRKTQSIDEEIELEDASFYVNDLFTKDMIIFAPLRMFILFLLALTYNVEIMQSNIPSISQTPFIGFFVGMYKSFLPFFGLYFYFLVILYYKEVLFNFFFASKWNSFFFTLKSYNKMVLSFINKFFELNISSLFKGFLLLLLGFGLLYNSIFKELVLLLPIVALFMLIVIFAWFSLTCFILLWEELDKKNDELFIEGDNREISGLYDKINEYLSLKNLIDSFFTFSIVIGVITFIVGFFVIGFANISIIITVSSILLLVFLFFPRTWLYSRLSSNLESSLNIPRSSDEELNIQEISILIKYHEYIELKTSNNDRIIRWLLILISITTSQYAYSDLENFF